MQKAVKSKAKGKVSEMRKVLLHTIWDTKLFRQIQRHGYIEVFQGLLEEERNFDNDTLWSLCSIIDYENDSWTCAL